MLGVPQDGWVYPRMVGCTSEYLGAPGKAEVYPREATIRKVLSEVLWHLSMLPTCMAFFS